MDDQTVYDAGTCAGVLFFDAKTRLGESGSLTVLSYGAYEWFTVTPADCRYTTGVILDHETVVDGATWYRHRAHFICDESTETGLCPTSIQVTAAIPGYATKVITMQGN